MVPGEADSSRLLLLLHCPADNLGRKPANNSARDTCQRTQRHFCRHPSHAC